MYNKTLTLEKAATEIISPLLKFRHFFASFFLCCQVPGSPIKGQILQQMCRVCFPDIKWKVLIYISLERVMVEH